MKKYEYLVLGSNGLLGSNVIKVLKKKKLSYFTVARKKSNFNLNLKFFNKLKKIFLKNKFNVVINCAGIIDIDYCEKHFKSALIINCLLVKFLTKMSKKYNLKLVQISTDHVYKGAKFKLNSEKSKIFAINKYAKTKILSEKYPKKLKRYLIIRTNFTGKRNDTFINWVINSVKKKGVIDLFNDMYTSTIDVTSCANIIVDLCSLNTKGIYNIGTRNSISKEKFAIKVYKKLKRNFNYRSVSCDIHNTPRGKNLGLNVQKIEKKIGYKMPTSDQAINNLIKEYK